MFFAKNAVKVGGFPDLFPSKSAHTKVTFFIFQTGNF